MYLTGIQLLVVPRKEIESGCWSKIFRLHVFVQAAAAAHDELGLGHHIYDDHIPDAID